MDTAISADGTTIAFDRIGTGPRVVLIPGASCTRGVTAPLAAALAEHCEVINLDRRGRGDSNDLTGAPYDPQREIEDLAAVLQSVGPAALYGHSSGAAVALRASLTGLPVTKLIVHDAPYSLEPSMGNRAYDVELRRLLEEGAYGDAMALFLTKVGLPADMIEGMRRAPHWPGMEAVAPTLAYDSGAMGDSEGGAVPFLVLEAVAVPALIMVGGADHGFMIDIARALQTGIPDAQLVHLVGAGHDAGPEIVAPPLIDFLTA